MERVAAQPEPRVVEHVVLEELGLAGQVRLERRRGLSRLGVSPALDLQALHQALTAA